MCELHGIYTNSMHLTIVLFTLDLSQETEKCGLLPFEIVLLSLILMIQFFMNLGK